MFYPIINSKFKCRRKVLVKDYKSTLQEYTQEVFGCVPVYEMLSRNRPDHKKVFIMQVKIKDEVYASANGLSKKSAQQSAAKLTLKILKQL